MRPAKAGHTNVVVTGASGCGTNGYYAFVGAGYENYAGGQARNGPGNGYSSVVDGYQNESCDAFTAISGGYQNTIGGDGGGQYSFIGGGDSNAIEGYYSFIGAGNNNTVGKYGTYDSSYASAIVAGNDNTVAAQYSFIGAGNSNTILGDYYSFIGAGYNNSITGSYSTIGAGFDNTIGADDSTIAGGYDNTVTGYQGTITGGYENSTSGTSSTIAGGYDNTVSGSDSSIAGGIQNTVSGEYATVAGGYLNKVSGEQAIVGGGYGNSASGKDSTIPGGDDNIASGSNSFAAGTKSNAAATGSFVWSDDTSGATALESTVADSFLARAAGGFYLYSSANLGSGVKLAPGSGSWSSLSDRNAKHDIQEVNDEQILTKLAALPVSTWSYNEENGVTHLGPMAQDFRAAFGLGEDEKHISTVDEEGVALAAIKALKTENDALRDAHRIDESRLARLESRLDALEANAR